MIPRPDDTNLILAAIASHQALDRQIKQAREAQRILEGRVDDLRRELWPEYPTPAQREGIKEAARRVKAAEKSRSHLGDPTPTYELVVVGDRGFISAKFDAPFMARGASSAKLWEPTEEELAEIRRLVEAEGLRIVDHWSGVEFLSMVTEPVS